MPQEHTPSNKEVERLARFYQKKADARRIAETWEGEHPLLWEIFWLTLLVALVFLLPVIIGVEEWIF
jgi:hypothetical protein